MANFIHLPGKSNIPRAPLIQHSVFTISKKNPSINNQLDYHFYREFYSDLEGMDDDELWEHWHVLGVVEQRQPNFSSLLISKNIDPQVLDQIDFDFDFYIGYYADLKKFGVKNRYRAILHYLLHGIKDQRYPNLSKLLKSHKLSASADLHPDFDYDFYVELYPDIRSQNINNALQAKVHFLLHGQEEGRVCSLQTWLESHHCDSHFVPNDLNLKVIRDINRQQGIEVKLNSFLDLLSGQSGYPFLVNHEASANANFYFEVAKHYLTTHHRESAKNLLKTALGFEKRGEFLELLGNLYLEETDYESASAHFKEAIQIGGISKWIFANLGHCQRMLSHHREALDIYVQGILNAPEFSFTYDRLEECINEFWLKQQGKLEALAVVNDREALINYATQVTQTIYDCYLQSFGTAQAPKTINACNTNRILIVGDYHINQCVRYRINQKIEQLEASGKTVKAISWTELEHHHNLLALFDTIIFYRVSAQPQVIKAIAQANATGKLCFYEIDDLLFDAIYPPPIESFGGYVDSNTYIGLTKGMALFHAAARLCRLGIASTALLAEKLEKVVFAKKCFLHRNGLDKLNRFKKPTLSQKTTVDIFYGSGTMAHNSDFSDLVLPALTQLLHEFDHVRLTVAGYLKLPTEFTQVFSSRIRQLPLITDMQAYWSLIEQADINLAVLHDDAMNGCKSELKWFEAATLGIATVMSSTANYRDVVSDGHDGLLAATPEDWYRQLKLLASSPQLRFDIATHAQKKALENYGINNLSANISTIIEQGLTHSQGSIHVKRKKIALVNVFFPPQSIGGATRVISDNFDILQKQYGNQFELCVFTSDSECKTPYQLSLYNYKGIRVYRATILWRENMDWHPKDDKMAELFNAFLQTEQPDLVHFHCVQRLTASIVDATRHAQIPYVITLHDAWWISDFQFLVDPEGNIYPEGHPDAYAPRTLPNQVTQLDSIERSLYLKGLLRHARAALSVSESFAKIYEKNEISNIVVNKNGISESVNWQAKQTDYTPKVVLAHIGGMAEHKGYFLLQSAITQLQPENIELLVVDHTKSEGDIVHAYWGAVPVTFIGPVKQSNVYDLYRKIDILCAPSKWPESYGLVTREASACGCWVIASNKGGIGEDVIEGKSGFVIEPDLPSLKACLAVIDKNPSQFKDLANPLKPRLVSEQVEELSTIYAKIG